MRSGSVAMSLLMVIGCFCNSALAAEKSPKDNPLVCYDAHDPNDIRLWDQAAPGAIGDDPCRDIPHMRVYPAQNNAKGTGGGTAILLVPGGGYDQLTNTKEQVPVAEYFSRQSNVTTFILYYRLVQGDGTYRYPVPMWDGQRALKTIRAHASQWNIDPSRIGAFGFSAGGHLATMLAEHSATDFDLSGASNSRDAIDAQSGKVDFLGLGYPVISMNPEQYGNSASHKHLLTGYSGRELEKLEHYLSGQQKVSAHTPPVFIFVSADDKRIDPQNSIQFDAALKAASIPAELHVFPYGGHGVGLANDIPEEQTWPELFQKWLISQGFLAK